MTKKEIRINTAFFPKWGNLKKYRVILFLIVAFIVWQLKISSTDVRPIFLLDENEIKIILIYGLGITLFSISINVLIFLSAALLVGLQSQELAGIIVFISLIGVLFKSIKNIGNFEK